MVKPNLTLIEDEAGVAALTQYLKDKTFVALDTETTGVIHGSTVIGASFCASTSEAFYIVLYRWDVATQILVPVVPKNVVAELLATLKGKSLILHNAIFDCLMIENFFKVRLIDDVHTDTMVLAHLLNENRRIGLKELGSYYFGDNAVAEAAEMKASVLANGGKLTKTQYEMYKANYKLMGKYGAKDAWLTYMLFETLIPELFEQDLDKFFYEDESMPLLRSATYDLNSTGLRVDMQTLLTLKKTLEAECAEAKAFIYSEIDSHVKIQYPGTNKKTQFNIGASQQLSWLLFGHLELEFNRLTAKGKEVAKHLTGRIPYSISAKRDFIRRCKQAQGEILKPECVVNGKRKKATKIKAPWAYIQCDKKTLQKYSTKYKWIESLLEYKRKTKLLTTYVQGIERQVQYGIIRPSFLQTGTTSGRYASREPNFQNLPRDDKRIKSCIVPRPGKIFVGADYSQLEPRVFAYFSGDARLLAAFGGQDDFYSVIGMEVYSKTDCVPRKEGSPEAFGIKYKKLRDLSKVIALASTYGATAHQLAPTTGKSIEDTQRDIDNYFEQFPGVKEMMLNSHEAVKTIGQVTNLFGRPRRIPEAKKINKIYGKMAHGDYPYEVRNMLNLAVNHRIQSTGASIVNRAAIMFCKSAKAANIQCKLTLQVHDSLVAECDEGDAKDVALLLQDAMESAVKLEGIALEAVPKIGLTLAEV